MKNLSRAWLLLGFWMFLWPYASYGQQAETPVYKDGEWWRIKREVTRYGTSSTACSESFSEYLIRIADEKPIIFGAKGDQLEPIDCPRILSLVLGRRDLEFPIHVGLKWSRRVSVNLPGLRQTWTDYQYEVKSWGKIKTPKGEFDAFKIERTHLVYPRGGASYHQTETYYYAPAVKAIVHSSLEDPTIKTATTLVDFSISP